MPLLAMIFVYQCETCQTAESVDINNDSQLEAFEDSWASGVTYYFCPKCKDTNYAKARIAGEKFAFDKVKDLRTEEKPNVPSL